MPSVFFLFPSPRTLAQMFKQSQDWHNSWIPNSKQPSNTEGKNVKLWVRGFAKQWSSKRRGTMQTSIRFHSPKRFDYVSLTGSFLCLFHTVRIFPSNCHLKKKKADGTGKKKGKKPLSFVSSKATQILSFWQMAQDKNSTSVCFLWLNNLLVCQIAGRREEREALVAAKCSEIVLPPSSLLLGAPRPTKGWILQMRGKAEVQLSRIEEKWGWGGRA